MKTVAFTLSILLIAALHVGDAQAGAAPLSRPLKALANSPCKDLVPTGKVIQPNHIGALDYELSRWGEFLLANEQRITSQGNSAAACAEFMRLANAENRLQRLYDSVKDARIPIASGDIQLGMGAVLRGLNQIGRPGPACAAAIRKASEQVSNKENELKTRCGAR